MFACLSDVLRHGLALVFLRSCDVTSSLVIRSVAAERSVELPETRCVEEAGTTQNVLSKREQLKSF